MYQQKVLKLCLSLRKINLSPWPVSLFYIPSTSLKGREPSFLLSNPPYAIDSLSLERFLDSHGQPNWFFRLKDHFLSHRRARHIPPTQPISATILRQLFFLLAFPQLFWTALFPGKASQLIPPILIFTNSKDHFHMSLIWFLGRRHPTSLNSWPQKCFHPGSSPRLTPNPLACLKDSHFCLMTPLQIYLLM